MNEAENPGQEREEPANRLSRMSQASIRITETLDLDTVLRGVVDGACSLTGARLGGITVLDEAGQLQAFINSALPRRSASHSLSCPEGCQQLETW